MNEDRKATWHTAYKVFSCILLSILILINVLGFSGFRLVTISGDSMFPNLHSGSVVISKKHKDYKTNDVIVLNAYDVDPRVKKGEKEYVKRVIAKEGQTVEYNGKDIFVDGHKQNQTYLSNDARKSTQALALTSDSKQLDHWTLNDLSKRTFHDLESKKDMFYFNKYSIMKEKVPKNMYFVLGDNRKISNDSRYYGFVPKKDIIGKVHTIPFVSIGTPQQDMNVNQ